jgi:hypothetical protein
MMEAALQALLLTACPRVFPDVAPNNTAAPWVTWQALGGESLGYLDNTAADKRHVLLQINVWSVGRLDSLSLIRQIEDLMRASTAFIATPTGESVSMYEGDTKLYGCLQRFSIYAPR